MPAPNAFRQTHTLAQRKQLAQKIIKAYPDRTPLVLVSAKGETIKRMIVHPDRSLAEIMHYLRQKETTIESHNSLVFMTETGIAPCVSELAHRTYTLHKHEDGFLYLVLVQENTFG